MHAKITDNGYRENSEYDITAKNGDSAILRGSTISLYFPMSVVFPCPCHKKILNSDILFNGEKLPKPPNLKCDGYNRILEISTPKKVEPFSSFSIVIKRSASIKNPMDNNNPFRIGMKLNDKSNAIFYSNVIALEGLISTPKIYVFPALTGHVAEFVFVFHTKKGFFLKKGSPIGVVFPYGAVLPKNPNASSFSINGRKLWSGTVVTQWNKRTYILNLPFDVNEGQSLVIKISKEAGIRLPSYEGFYKGGLIYNFNIKTVLSSPVYVRYKPVIGAEINISPIKYPHLKKYNFKPEITITAISTFGYLSNTLFYSIDNDKNFKIYTSPFKIGEGFHTVYCYVENSIGIKSKVRKISVDADLTPPSLEFYKVEKERDNLYKVIFKSSELLSNVSVNGKFTVCSLNKEFYIYSKEKNGDFSIKAVDLAGNVTEKTFVVER